MPHLWIPRTKILEPREALAVPRGAVGGRFRIEGRLPDGRSRVIRDWRANLILDAGLERWGTGQINIWCSLGSGTTAPIAADTEMETFIVSAETMAVLSGVQDEAPYYGWQQAQSIFTPPGGAGHTIAEVGWGWEADGSGLWSRSLLKDEEGAPQEFEWLADESLTITYELRIYPWLSDSTGSISLGGNSYACTIRASRVAAAWAWAANYQDPVALFAKPTLAPILPSVFDGAIRNYLLDPLGTAAVADEVAVDAYEAASYERTGTATWGTGSATFATGITALTVASSIGRYQVGFSPAIPKTNAQTLALNLASPAWSRAA